MQYVAWMERKHIELIFHLFDYLWKRISIVFLRLEVEYAATESELRCRQADPDPRADGGEVDPDVISVEDSTIGKVTVDLVVDEDELLTTTG